MKKIAPEYSEPPFYADNALWDSPVKCGVGEWVCGLRVKMQEHEKDKDETSLNQVKFKCCSYQKDVSRIYVPKSDDGELQLGTN